MSPRALYAAAQRWAPSTRAAARARTARCSVANARLLPPATPPAPAVFVDTCPYIPKYRAKPDNAQMAANLAAANTTEQTAWLRQQLRDAARACNATLVVGHHPLYSGGEHGNAPDLVAAWGADLTAHVDGYIAGHDHTLQHLTAADTDFIVTGAGSKLRVGTVQTPELQW